MPRRVVVLEVGRFGMAVGERFWELVREEHSSEEVKGCIAFPEVVFEEGRP